MSLLSNLARLSSTPNIYNRNLEEQDRTSMTIDEEIARQFVLSDENSSKITSQYENIVFPKTTKTKYEENWIFDKIVGEQKCTSCHNKNLNRFKNERQKITNTINTNYQNFLQNRSETGVKNIEYEFSDDEYV